ncbi:ABC transporter permease [Natranaeroarchaeum sulfidigenes]|uniref:ABC-type nitrate/sulfonate/bicarbonate transportsystem, permease component n=1 Tax=Natranaeroarchaeum sulfidigenes TaxID=2784880 RepID=A0A897MIA3_9EURY|nr:ABC transporter permease [Natranaeroarchaeum sulfidigenes]QSG01860.1 ABC-type nitrate/sulfonate/bicarbonate transportsystem, permease component [Natranaeroarchaeum sulfidigenes]
MATGDRYVADVSSFRVPSEVALPAAVFISILVFWELIVAAMAIPEFILPPPSAIAGAFVENYGTIAEQLLITLQAFGLGATLSIVSGYLMAVAMAQSSVLETTFYPYVIIARSIPVVALLPLFIVWFGFGFPTIVVISYLISFFAMVVNALSGFKSTDDELIEMLESFSANRREVFVHVYLYASLPAVFAGIKICVILSFTGVIVGEFLAGSQGIGHLILTYNNHMATAEMFAGIAAVSITQLVLFGSVTALERHIVDWQYGNGGA